MNRIIIKIIHLFPVWALLVSVWAYYQPEHFIFLKPIIVPLLSLVMLGMGLTLKWANFREVFKNPRVILLGVAMQFILMPLFAYIISKGLGLQLSFLIGMILVGSSPGGTASNVICFLAGANVALSITLTMTSTLLSVVLTPLLSWLYLKQSVSVDVIGIFIKVLQIVLVPVILGTTLNTFLNRSFKKIQVLFPLVSILAILWIIAIIVAVNREQIQQVGWLILLAVILHNSMGLSSGYFIARLFKCDVKTSRTLSIEVGMQNSGLGVALAMDFFTAAAAIPGAVFSVWHNISGAVLACYWKYKTDSSDVS